MLFPSPEYHCPKRAGWWVWGQCAWIGSGWCSGKGPWQSVDGRLVKGNPGMGINRQIPHLGNPGRGINRQIPHLGNPGRGETIRAWARLLAERLRDARVCCGDWGRVVTPSATAYTNSATIGVFVDPPYSDADIKRDLYSIDERGVAEAVRVWAAEAGADPKMRIVLASYDTHPMPDGWREVPWIAARANCYGNTDNPRRETLWLSPHCLGAPTQGQLW